MKLCLSNIQIVITFQTENRDGDIFRTIPTFTKTNSLLCFHKLLCLGCMTSLVFKRQKRDAINEIDPFSKRYISLIEIISIKKI